MRKLFLLFIIYLSLLFFSCQKEFLEDLHPSSGSLKKDNTGNCFKINVAGTYTAGNNVGDTNYLIVEVNITSAGSYLIKSDTVNGYSFKAQGNFTDTGSFRIKLAAAGKPISAGINSFTVMYGNSTCIALINVLPVQGAAPAVFTLAGSPDSCMNAVVLGNYLKNISLDTSDKVNIKINVTTAGTYSITTNTVNGYKFSSAGIILNTGLQTITLAASGTPLNTGVNIFSINAGSSTCSFSVKVLAAIAVTNNDHFPLTTNSYWTYDDLWNAGDTLKRSIIDSSFTNGSLFKIMSEQQNFNSYQYLFRKIDSVYYEYTSIDKYTTSVKFLPEIKKEIPFLKENLTTGDVWTTEEYIGPSSFGQVIFLRYEFTCDDANASITINGKTYTNVYKIVMRPQIRSAVTYPYNVTGERRDLYYAKGVGLIYTKFTVQNFVQLEWQIRNWMVK